jgi:L-ascorbate oxidase
MMVAPFSDGTPMSQWPIPARHFFDYELRPDVGYAGTYFYHSHVGFQAVTASGPLIVEGHTFPYKYDDERIVHLTDFFSSTDEVIESDLTGPNFVWPGETNDILVNGQGRLTTNASGQCTLAAIDVEPGKTYRLRFIGGTALSFVSLAFEEHTMTIIEADGHYTQPFNTSYLQIGSGQRFSVLLSTKPETEVKENQFYMQLSTLERPTSLTTFAVLRYSGATSDLTSDLRSVPSTPPLPVANTTNGWLNYQLRPLTPDSNFPTLSEVDRTITITLHQNISSSNQLTQVFWLENGYPWIDTLPPAPYLVEVYEDKFDTNAAYQRAIANGGLDRVTRTFPAKKGEVLDIIWQNTGSTAGALDTHPFHAHGAHYYDLGGGDGAYDSTANEALLQNNPPVLRDTTMLYRYRTTTTPGAPSGWRAWRLRASDAGVWMVHCHILQHMLMGMQTVFVVGDKEDIVQQSGQAFAGYLTYGGSAYGNETHAPDVMHSFDD